MNIDPRATASLLGVIAACSATPEPPCVLPDSIHRLPAELREASGAVYTADGTLWVIADSGEPVLFAIGDDNRIGARVRIGNARVQDWEDLARGSCPAGDCLYIADIGDNLHAQRTRSILRIASPAPRDTTVSAERFRFRYPDGPSDAEAAVVLDDGSLLIITKGRNRAVAVYRYAPPFRTDEIVTLEHVQNLTPGIVQLPRQPTGATRAGPDEILVRSYARLQLYRWERDSLAAVGPPVDVGPLGEPQGEAVAAGPNDVVVLIGEQGRGGTIARLQCRFAAAGGGTDDAPYQK